jgi:hypothetical protein
MNEKGFKKRNLKYFEKFKQVRQELIDKMRFDTDADLDNDHKLRQALIDHDLLVEDRRGSWAYNFPPNESYPEFDRIQRTISIDVPKSQYPNFLDSTHSDNWLEVSKDSQSLFRYAHYQMFVSAQDEIGMSGSSPDALITQHPELSGYLIFDKMTKCTHSSGDSVNYQAIGGCTIHHQSEYEGLQWVWIHPYCRGKSKFSRLWSHLNSFEKPLFIEPPYSRAMIGFLRKKEESCKAAGKNPSFKWNRHLGEDEE